MKQQYRRLKEGEIIQQGDEIFNDSTDRWELVVRSIGDACPDPRFTSHRQFRRKIDQFRQQCGQEETK